MSSLKRIFYLVIFELGIFMLYGHKQKYSDFNFFFALESNIGNVAFLILLKSKLYIVKTNPWTCIMNLPMYN